MIDVNDFEWDNNNIRKPLAHGVSPEETEEVFYNHLMVRRTRFKRYLALGTTDAGRYLTIIFEHHAGIVRVITARLMTKSEYQLYSKKRRV